MTEHCIINLASGSWFPKGQLRLQQSLKTHGFTGDVLLFTNETQVGAPRHASVPYAFKGYAIQEAVKRGYRYVLWLDASMWAVKPVEPLFEHIKKEGHALFVTNWTGNYTSDKCLANFGLTRDEAMQVPMIMGGCQGLDMHSPTCQEYHRRWMEYAKDGSSFIGSWTNRNQEVSKDERCKGHRHDQSVASIVAWQLGMGVLTPHKTFVQYYSENVGPTIVLLAAGM